MKLDGKATAKPATAGPREAESLMRAAIARAGGA
jgi:hypothetical protein